jgi:hypothetical protein
MIRGTTPTHTFELPFDTRNIKKLAIYYSQGNEVMVRKGMEHCIFKGNVVITTFTQEETLLFKHGKNVQVQMKIRTRDGETLASFIETIPVLKCLSNEVI